MGFDVQHEELKFEGNNSWRVSFSDLSNRNAAELLMTILMKKIPRKKPKSL